MTDAPKRNIRRCNLCGRVSLHVVEVVIDGVTIEVERCAMCDTSPCPNCTSRNLDPRAGNCRHCNAHTGLKKPEGETPHA